VSEPSGPTAPAPADPSDPGVAALFEGAPRFLARLAAARLDAGAPSIDADPGAFFDAARAIAHAMPEADQIELLDAHPRLGAPPDTVSAMSFREQGYDRTHAPDLATELRRLNDAYEAHFGFRYCVFVAGRSRAELLPGFDAALGAPRDAELRRALDAVVDIAADRHARLTAGATEGAR
jgi:2-oxo-4-hydroxy-4-carboxy--5-ureidoimidazoline (OHCU) decarboxylase